LTSRKASPPSPPREATVASARGDDSIVHDVAASQRSAQRDSAVSLARAPRRRPSTMRPAPPDTTRCRCGSSRRRMATRTPPRGAFNPSCEASPAAAGADAESALTGRRTTTSRATKISTVRPWPDKCPCPICLCARNSRNETEVRKFRTSASFLLAWVQKTFCQPSSNFSPTTPNLLPSKHPFNLHVKRSDPPFTNSRPTSVCSAPILRTPAPVQSPTKSEVQPRPSLKNPSIKTGSRKPSVNHCSIFLNYRPTSFQHSTNLRSKFSDPPFTDKGWTAV